MDVLIDTSQIVIETERLILVGITNHSIDILRKKS